MRSSTWPLRYFGQWHVLDAKIADHRHAGLDTRPARSGDCRAALGWHWQGSQHTSDLRLGTVTARAAAPGEQCALASSPPARTSARQRHRNDPPADQPPMAPLAIAIWKAATSRPLASSAWSGAARTIQIWNPTRNAQGEAPQGDRHRRYRRRIAAREQRRGQKRRSWLPPKTIARRSLRPASQPPNRLPKKPPMP